MSPGDHSTFRACALVPTYQNPLTIERVVAELLEQVAVVLVVDDGSGPQARQVLRRLEEGDDRVRLYRLVRNQGKGAAVKAGLRFARHSGFTHAVQVDADGQHDLSRVGEFVDTARREPEALVCGFPVFDDSAPRVRLVARKFSRFWVDLEAGAGVIRDPLVGFRVYPLQRALAAGARSNRMAFDAEIAVRMAWGGAPVINLPVAVRYLSADEGGISHFRPVADNLGMSWAHTRMITRRILHGLGVQQLR